MFLAYNTGMAGEVVSEHIDCYGPDPVTNELAPHVKNISLITTLNGNGDYRLSTDCPFLHTLKLGQEDYVDDCDDDGDQSVIGQPLLEIICGLSKGDEPMRCFRFYRQAHLIRQTSTIKTNNNHNGVHALRNSLP